MKSPFKNISNPFEGLEKIFNFVKRSVINLLAVVAMAFMIVMIVRNAIHAISIQLQIGELAELRSEYQDSITRDSTIVERIKYDEELERYARENYYMQHPNEEIFIIE